MNANNSSIVFALLSLLLGGGGGRLLDYVPSDMFWRERNVPIKVESLIPELKTETGPDISAAIADLGAADPRIRDAAADKIIKAGPGVLPQVQEARNNPSAEIAQRASALSARLITLSENDRNRRLMAIRTLGELKDPAALPVLRPLVQSRERFVAAYARRAIAAISQPPATPPAANAAPQTGPSTRAQAPATHPSVAANDDVWLLPSKCRAVAALSPWGKGPMQFAFAEAHLPVRSNQTPRQVIERIGKLALSVAEKIGDVRIDRLTIGVSDDIGENGGFVVLVVAGEFDAKAIASLAHQGGVAVKKVDGMEVFQPDGETAFFMPSDERLIILASPAGENYPLREMTAASANGSGGLKDNAELTRRIEALDPLQPIWSVVELTSAYKSLLGLDGVKVLTLTSQMKSEALKMTIRGDCQSADAARTATRQVMDVVQSQASEMKQMEPIVPALKAAEDFFSSIHSSVEGREATLTAEIQNSPAAVFVLPLMLTFGDQREVIPPPPHPGARQPGR